MIGIINNEAIGLIALSSVLFKMKKINIVNSYLALPLLFDKKIRLYLKRKNTKILSLQELVVSHSSLFSGFNEKYVDSLIVTTNSILLGIELNLFEMHDNELVMINDDLVDVTSIGSRALDIISASENVAKILSEEPQHVYSQLRIKI